MSNKNNRIIRDATDADLPGITDIYNHTVLHTAAVWNDTIADLANRQAWLGERRTKGYPVLVAIEAGFVVGYASFGDWRAWFGYRYTVENSIYVHHEHWRRGIAKALMRPLIERATAMGKHVMVAGIEAQNTASIQLHAQLGFRETGRMAEVGTKFGRWLDLVFMQLLLDTRMTP